MKNIAITFFLFLSFGVTAQTFTNVKIDEGSASGGPEEPAIAVSLTDSNVIVAGANIHTTYRSLDGGKTWKRKNMKSKYGVWGDPCIVPTLNGKFMYFHLSIPKGHAYVNDSFLDRIVCQTTKNNGKRFHKGKYMGLNPPKDQDKEWAVYDLERGRTYATWTQFDKYGSSDSTHRSTILSSYSDNDGKSWSDPITMSHISGNCLDGDQTTEGAVPAIGLNGEMHVSWALDEKIYFNTFTEGATVTEEIVIARQVGGWNQLIDGLDRSNGMPVTVSDMSNGPHRGAIYVSWSDQRNGELNTDVFVKKSIDGGKSWSNAIRVNDDHTNSHQFLPWMTIDQVTGYVYLLFYDRRDFTDNQTNVYLAVSKDGGATFLNHKISESPFTPISRVFFGDYINISAHNGVVRPIWTRYENGKLSIWTALLDGF
jgi:hypothetical protein